MIILLECGFIKIYRSLCAWEWYDDVNTKTLFLHLLLTVNYEDKQWHGMEIKRGSRVTSLATLAAETRLSVKAVRTALKHLNETGEVVSQGHAQNTVVTVVNYDKYQQEGKPSAKQGQTEGKAGSNEGQQCNKAKKDKESKNKDLCAFDELWELYPKKQSKNEAMKSYIKLKPSAELQATIRNAVATAKTCEDWRKEGGRYVPMLSTWLNNRRWEDEITQTGDFKSEKYERVGEHII